MSLSIFVFGVLCLISGASLNESQNPAYPNGSDYEVVFKVVGTVFLVIALIFYALIVYFWGIK